MSQNYSGFPGSSAEKESPCNAGDTCSIPGLGKSTGEGIGYPLQYSWASLVAQMVKNLPSMQETWVQSLGWEDPLEEAWQPNPVFLPRESPWREEHGELQSMESQRIIFINIYAISLALERFESDQCDHIILQFNKLSMISHFPHLKLKTCDLQVTCRPINVLVGCSGKCTQHCKDQKNSH